MDNRKTVAASAIAANLFATEHNVDSTALSLAALATSMAEARPSAKFQFLDGHDVHADLAEAQVHLAKLRFYVGRAHQRMTAVAERYAIPAFGWGDEGDTPPQGRSTGVNVGVTDDADLAAG